MSTGFSAMVALFVVIQCGTPAAIESTKRQELAQLFPSTLLLVDVR